VAGPAGCWEVPGFSRSSLELEVFGGAGGVNRVPGSVSLASFQESAASSAGCEDLSDLTLITGYCPIFWFKLQREPEINVTNAPIGSIICIFSYFLLEIFILQ